MQGEGEPLNEVRLEQPIATINRLHALLHAALALALLYYRATTLFSSPGLSVGFCSAALFAAEILSLFIWLLFQAYRWRPVARKAFPERLPVDGSLPGVDVFICTADPEKEPPVGVMNTVVSAMSLDYPPEKLTVYLSDDAGSDLTLFALKEAFAFACSWVPFCNKHGILTRAPEAYFSAQEGGEEQVQHCTDREKIKLMYEKFKERVKSAEADNRLRGGKAKNNHPPSVVLMHEEPVNMSCERNDKMPSLVYVAREKRPGVPHSFKAGALNALLRVSGLFSNAPYILVLDCDMYCNDPNSARQAMCFHLDSKLSPSLAFVQFPQAFHNIGPNDIYGGSMRWIFKSLWKGCDGINGPVLSGTNFYIKRRSLLECRNIKPIRDGEFSHKDVGQLKQTLGNSYRLIGSIYQSKPKIVNRAESKELVLQEALNLAFCTYEKETKWGKEIGFRYGSVVEDYFTGFNIHCQGWKSVCCNPSRPPFLGSTPTRFCDVLVQSKRWTSGLLQVAFSKFNPLIYGPPRTSILQSMCYSSLALMPLWCFSVGCYAIVPPLCLMNGVPLFPKASSPWFLVFVATYLSYLAENIRDVLVTGGSFKSWWEEERIFMMRSVSAYYFGFLNVVVKAVGMSQVDFELTNKADDEEQLDRYYKGVFDFQGCGLLIYPIVIITLVNITSLLGGIGRIIAKANNEEMLGQICLSIITLIASYPVIEGIFVRKDRGRVAISTTLACSMISMIVIAMAHLFFML